jgi:hypothetical protein
MHFNINSSIVFLVCTLHEVLVPSAPFFTISLSLFHFLTSSTINLSGRLSPRTTVSNDSEIPEGVKSVYLYGNRVNATQHEPNFKTDASLVYATWLMKIILKYLRR